MRELLETYLMGQYILPMTWDNCLNSREDLVLLLSGWLQLTSAKTIGDPNNGIGVTALIRLKVGDGRFKLNNDTTREGVETFIANEIIGYPWIISETNRVSNAENGEHIRNLQMYIVN
jgi:hypothetical protein